VFKEVNDITSRLIRSGFKEFLSVKTAAGNNIFYVREEAGCHIYLLGEFQLNRQKK
jgi:hypothetical protein